MRAILMAGCIACILTWLPMRPSEGAELQAVDGGAPNAGRRDWLEGSSRRILANEPDFASDKPLWFALELGNGKNRLIAAVLDESKGTGTGYDTLYLDANNNGDLTDDKPIKVTKGKSDDPRSTALECEPVTVKVLYHDGSDRQLRVKLAMQCYRYGGDEDRANWNLNYSVEQHMEGKVSFGGKTMLAAVYDAARLGDGGSQINGCFDDYGVDRLKLDLDGDGKFSDAEDFPLSKVISYDGKLWQLEIDSAGRKLDVKPSTLPAGKLALKGSFDAAAKIEAGSVQLISGLGYAFRCDVSKPDPVLVPAAKYLIEGGSMTLADAKGAKWAMSFSYPKTLRVAADQDTALALGKPFKLQPTVKDTLFAGSRVSVAHKLAGAGGETCSGVTQGGKQIAPTVRITDAEGIKILEGAMEFG